MAETNQAEGTAQTKSLPTSTPSHLKLLKYAPEAYAGITPEQAVVVIFPQDQPLMELKGDQGTTKSSNISALKTLLGAEEPANAINSITGKKAAELTFQVGGAEYVSRVTKTGFTLTEIKRMANGKDIRSEIKKPKDVLRSLIGPLGSDPNFLKSKNPKDQIKFVREMMVLSPEYLQVEESISAIYKESYASRTTVNKVVSEYGAKLVQNDRLFVSVKGEGIKKAPGYNLQSEKYSVDLKDRDESIAKAFASARDEANAFTATKVDLHNTKNSLVEYRNAIWVMESQLKELAARIEKGKEKIEETCKTIEVLENKLVLQPQAEKALQDATAALQESNTFKEEKHAFDTSIKMFEDYQSAIELQGKLNKKLDLLAEQKQELVQQITPDIEGFEICIPSDVDIDSEKAVWKEKNPEIDDAEIARLAAITVAASNREGIYYKGRSVAELSESELWELWLQLCNVSGVKAVFIENISSLGSSAIDKINELAANGCNVFYSAMERGLPALQISFYTQIK